MSQKGDGFRLGRKFPELSPYGTGHPGQDRPTRVSLHACVKYYLDLSSRRFAHHIWFLMTAFDFISISKMSLYNYITCRKPSTDLNRIATVSQQAFLTFLKQSQQRERLMREGRSDHIQNHDRACGASQLMKGVGQARARIWGTNEERKLTRDRAFAMATR